MTTLLTLCAGIDVVGEAADAGTALQLVARTGADVVLMDLHLVTPTVIRGLPGPHGNAPRLIALTTYLDEDSAGRLPAGIVSALSKGASAEQIEAAVRATTVRRALGPTTKEFSHE